MADTRRDGQELLAISLSGAQSNKFHPRRSWLSYSKLVIVPSGILVPSLGTGAIIGRLVGQLVMDTSPGLFATARASAFVAGVSGNNGVLGGDVRAQRPGRDFLPLKMLDISSFSSLKPPTLC